MTVGTAFHPRTAPLNAKMQWREWSGFFAASEYHDSHVIEYNAIREAAALIDVSPLFKYELRGPDALRLVDRLITRDATKLTPGRVFYTPWCDEHGKVIDDGTIHRLDDADGGQVIRWTAADPQYRWLHLNAHGLDVDIADVSERDAAIALQGPLARKVLEAASGEPFGDLRYFRRRTSNLGGVPVDVSRTGYTGDLGYELWIPADRALEAWDALVAAGEPYRIRPGRDARARRGAPGGRPGPDRGRLHERRPLAHPGPELQPVRDRPGQARRPGQGRLRGAARPDRRGRRRRPRPPARRARHRAGPTSRPSTRPRGLRRTRRPP